MAEQERDITQNSSVPVLPAMGPPISNRDGPDNADNTGDEPHHLSVHKTDPPHGNSATPERGHHIVVHIHGHDFALGQSSQPELRAAAERAQLYQTQLGAGVAVPYAADFFAEKLHTLTRQFSREEAEESALRDADDYDLPNDTVRRDANHMRELGSFEALVKYHNDAQKTTGLNLTRVYDILSTDPEIEKLHEIVEIGAVIDTTPEFRPIHRTAPFRNLQTRMLPVYKKAVADMHAKNKVLIFDVEDIPQHIYARMHTANEYHWRPEQGKVAGRPLLDCSNCAPGEIPLNSDATKELARHREISEGTITDFPCGSAGMGQLPH